MYIEKSIALGKTHKNLFMKAKISNEMGKKDEAIKLYEHAINRYNDYEKPKELSSEENIIPSS